MDNYDAYTNYIKTHGGMSYVLTIYINEQVPETEKQEITNTIYEHLHDKNIDINISNTNITLNWKVSDEKNKIIYFTGGRNFIYDDEAIQQHTRHVMQLLKNKLNDTASGDAKFRYLITKPLSAKICMTDFYL